MGTFNFFSTRSKTKWNASSFFVLKEDARPIISQNCPFNLRQLIQLCWSRNPQSLPTITDILNYFKDRSVKTIMFPGTNIEEVDAYLNHFKYCSNYVNELILIMYRSFRKT